jgi:Tol biopolymer transport system component
VRDLEGDETGVPVSAGDGDEYFPAWSQGGWIAFVRVDSPESSGIWVVRSDGSGLREVVSGRTVRAPAWSPDGTRIAFFGNLDEDSWDLYTVRADGTDLDRLTSANAYDRNPSWSPDGRTIVFVRGDNTTDRDVAEIHLLDLETRTVSAALTDNEVQDGNPVFSPDGSLIAFYRDSGPGYHIWLMNRDGSDERDVMADRDGSNLDPIWR